MGVISLLVAIFGKNFLNPKVRMLLLALGLTIFTIRARKIYKTYEKAQKEAEKAEQDYKVAVMLQAKQGHKIEDVMPPEPKAEAQPKMVAQPAT